MGKSRSMTFTLEFLKCSGHLLASIS